LNGVDPQAYFADVLSKLVNLWPASRLDELMPWAWAAAHSNNNRGVSGSSGQKSSRQSRVAKGPLTIFLSPEVLKSIRRKFCVTHRVLDVLVAEPSLWRPCVVAGVG
jgi:transposase IS66-like protein